jgi:hypothetical protein
MKINIKDGTIDIFVDRQKVLHIGQVSDENTINLFLYPKGDLIESIMHEENKNSKCTHELLVNREKKGAKNIKTPKDEATETRFISLCHVEQESVLS